MLNPAPTVSETDQLDAACRDLLAANRLEVVERTNIDQHWVAEHSGEEPLDALSSAAAKTTADGVLTVLVAVHLPGDAIGYHMLAARADGSV